MQMQVKLITETIIVYLFTGHTATKIIGNVGEIRGIKHKQRGHLSPYSQTRVFVGMSFCLRIFKLFKTWI